jgi:amidase
MMMNRREFIQFVGSAGSAIMAHPLLAKTAGLEGINEHAKPASSFACEEVTIAELQKRFVEGKTSAFDLVQQYLARIRQIDRHGPSLNAVIEINPDALSIARALDEERRSKGPRGPLHGIPVLLKDNLDTHDRMSTTAGSLALAGSIAAADSFVAWKLRQAGAVILGKTNLSEWANFRSTHSTSGWSGRGRQTRNPYALDRNPSGSSSGSAVAVSANLCAVAVGTETDGSILSPSSCNGIVGMKPTVGLVSRSGIIPIAHSQDTAGPMARTVADAAALLGCMAGADARDPATRESAGKSYADYTSFLDPKGLNGARLGVARQFFGSHGETDTVMERALGVLKHSGAILVDPVEFPTHGKFGEAEFEVLLYEFKYDLNLYLARLGPHAPVRTLKDIIAFNERNASAEMPFFGQEILIKAEAKGPLTEQPYLDALAKGRRMTREEGIDAVLEKHHLDAIVAPTCGPAHVTDPIYGDRDTGGSTSFAAVAGYPSITIPAGWVHGLPVGLSFFAEAYSEPKLLRLAYAFELASKCRRAPRFLEAASSVEY